MVRLRTGLHVGIEEVLELVDDVVGRRVDARGLVDAADLLQGGDVGVVADGVHRDAQPTDDCLEVSFFCAIVISHREDNCTSWHRTPTVILPALTLSSILHKPYRVPEDSR